MSKMNALPIGPLVRIVESMVMDPEGGVTLTNEMFSEMVGFSERTVMRWKSVGEIPWTKADVAAIRIGSHPLLVWGDDWLALDGEEAVS